MAEPLDHKAEWFYSESPVSMIETSVQTGNAKFLLTPRFDQSANATRMRIAGDRPLQMQVYDIHGNKVHEFTHEGAGSGIHLTNYQPGTYRVHVKTTNGPSAMADFTVPSTHVRTFGFNWP